VTCVSVCVSLARSDRFWKPVRSEGQLIYWQDQVDLSGLELGTYSVEFLPEDNKERLIYTSLITKI